MQFPVFFDNVIALIHTNTPESDGITAVYLADGRVKFSDFTPKTLRKRYYALLNNERGI